MGRDGYSQTAGHTEHARGDVLLASLPVSTVIIGCDTVEQLQENVQLAREFTPFSQHQLAGLTEKAEPVSKQSLFFRFYDRA